MKYTLVALQSNFLFVHMFRYRLKYYFSSKIKRTGFFSGSAPVFKHTAPSRMGSISYSPIRYHGVVVQSTINRYRKNYLLVLEFFFHIDHPGIHSSKFVYTLLVFIRNINFIILKAILTYKYSSRLKQEILFSTTLVQLQCVLGPSERLAI